MKRKKMLSLFLLILLILGTFTACGKPSEDEIRSKMESHLLEKYGEPFVVENIGTRDANGQKFYTARIYPKTIVGTPKEDDEYYYATVNIDILSNGKLRKTGDTYGEVQIREETEKYLLPKVKEIFGERVRLKTEPILKEKDDKNGLYYEYIIPSLQGAKDKVKNNPEKYRLELMLSIYIFDKIDNEKEERRREIFDFIQYLKKEGLFEYLRLQIRIVDERVLSNSYKLYREKEQFDNEIVYDKVINDTIEIPPLDFRREMTEILTKEYNNTEKEVLINNMNDIKKSELGKASWDGIDGNSLQQLLNFDSIGAIKELSISDFNELRKNGDLEKHYYNNLRDIVIDGELAKYKYIYLNSVKETN